MCIRDRSTGDRNSRAMSISTDQWQAWDPNPLTAAALAAAEDPSALLATRLAFGTAGLRGPMAPGTNAMNDLMVIQTTQGLAKYLLAHFGPAPEGSKHQVVIGYDHRCAEQWGLSSERFARLTAAVLTEAGLEPLVLDGLVPTPLVAFATKKLERCVAGVMVTASHNPAADNGYKVYWNQGVQFTPPHDAGIAAEILAQLEPWAVYSPEGVQLATAFTAEIAEQYYGEMKASLCRGIPSEAPLKVLYTAMHGVGLPWVQRAFAQFELPAMLLEESQCAPDASFATVAFPNPEEKGALDRAMATGTKEGAHLIIANDPDADRLAVAEAEEGGGWRVFTGNEIGALLAHWMLMSCKTERSKIAMLASTVSSKMLGAIAKAEGCKFEDTLTGFKWLGRRADELRAEGYDVVFAYEEAIGFACGDLISDKDGVSAAAVFTEMAAQEYNAGRTVSSLLQSLYRHGAVLGGAEAGAGSMVSL
eukprot:TRINITY_DN11658_c0_g1_i2.p1 TRINITY_DN11658_c0_g1~~TRINITY_DN11658_c0_g1_i2.p1  ORF type:complete len:476 (-),score=151.16 TRINITY_DN11658_c0_g1_i2:481-1908(-)